ncbi:MAG: SAM-dependent methyltransferase [Clostridium sp.]|nr:MAG: SAM-dependent methyltransferase [Clostridium sp.]
MFEKSDKGGTGDVWFYNMTNDGFTLDAKRQPCDGSDIPDIIERFNNLANEKKLALEKDKSFMVSVDEIRANDYDLTINKYREVEKEKKVYRSTSEIFDELEENYNKSIKLMKSLEDLLKGLVGKLCYTN